jgi:hypothetical protein
MTTKFREPTNELPQPFYLSSGGGEPPWTSHKAMQKVRPLTDEECDDLLTKFERGGLGYFKVRPWYEKIMAARGIEVGE